jgi:hypothetical protein
LCWRKSLPGGVIQDLSGGCSNQRAFSPSGRRCTWSLGIDSLEDVEPEVLHQQVLEASL